MSTASSRIQALRDWLGQLQVLADAHHPLGAEARERLPDATSLTPEGVDWALSNSLELHPNDAELANLVSSVRSCRTAHVLLSANLFVSPLRAIALAIAASPRVFVRPSRREPYFTALLHRAAPNAFGLVTDLSPASGDHVWAYGTDETMKSLVQQWPSGVILHAHGSGYGILAVDNGLGLSDADYDAMAIDVGAFDQRGCLSPRIVVVRGSELDAATVAERLFQALLRLETTLPLGRLADAEIIARRRHGELYRYVGHSFEAPCCLVTVDAERPSWTLPPSGRVVHVTRTDCLEACLAAHAQELTSVGTQAALLEPLQQTLPRARVVHFGRMQRPPLDGPVDRRSDLNGVLL
jgi:hypothetical protein